MRIGIFGGTFNPPHIGHIRSAKAAARQLELDLLIIIPSGSPPHKPLPDNSPPADMRLEMTRLAFRDSENTIVSDIEINDKASNYAVDTVAAIKRDYPGAEMFLLVGTDMYLSLDQWKDCEALLSTATPAVFSRGSDDIIKIADYSLGILNRYGAQTETVINNVVEISSSVLREVLPKREGVEYIAEACYSYIIKNRLYGAKPEWNWLRRRAHSMLSPLRIPHVLGCEEEAVRLAIHWGEDADEAREAAILHDITKILEPEENLAIMKEHGITAGELKKGEEKLLHAKTAAIIARSEFGSSNAVAEAIKWHTTGKARMTKLEKLIYLADYIEPARDFDGVDILRALAYESLDEAMRMGIEISVIDMKARGIDPNETTFYALHDLDRV